MFSPTKLLELSNRIYRLLLNLYPAPFRREYGYHMSQVFRDDLRGTLQEGGLLSVIGLWILALVDLLKTAVAEHFWEIFHMPIEKLTRWSGLAAVVGGPLFVATFASQAFWGFLDTIGLADFRFIHPLLAGIGLLLMALGVFGLYQRLPTTISSKLALVLSLFGILAGIMGLILWEVDVPAFFIGFAFFLPQAGVAMMGVIALSNKSLGYLSFAPLLPLVGLIGIALTSSNPGFPSPVTNLFLILYQIGWLLSGIALMMRQTEEPPEPGLFA